MSKLLYIEKNTPFIGSEVFDNIFEDREKGVY